MANDDATRQEALDELRRKSFIGTDLQLVQQKLIERRKRRPEMFNFFDSRGIIYQQMADRLWRSAFLAGLFLGRIQGKEQGKADHGND